MSDEGLRTEELRAIHKKLVEIAEHIGPHEPRPDDPEKARRWDQSLLWHMSNLSDHLHTLRNFSQVLSGLIEQLARKLDTQVEVSRENNEAIARLAEITRIIETRSVLIAEGVRRVAHEKPVLMRNLIWLETEPIEIALILATFGETLYYSVASDALIHSAFFQSLAVICIYPSVWAVIAGLVALVSSISFVSRKRSFRTAAAFANALYCGVTGALPVFYFPGVLGSLHHMILALGATWILLRGPSNAI